MTSQNIMTINSPHIASIETLLEYQKPFINARIGEYLKTHSIACRRTYKIAIKKNTFDKVCQSLESKYELFSTYDNRATILDENFIAELWIFGVSSYSGLTVNIASCSLTSCEKSIEKLKNDLKEYSIETTPIRYEVCQYDTGGLITTSYSDLDNSAQFNPLAVPFIENIDSYIDKFITSNASILILYGLPGTGKSTFAKYILSKMQEYVINTIDKPIFNVLYSCDENVFQSAQFFDIMVYQEYDAIVLEDFNQTIHKNTDDQSGLNPLNKLLSITDGVISKRQKIIITTNIESKTQIHNALVRPGRCFDAVNFRNLDSAEVNNLGDSYSKELELQMKSISVSEFYAKYHEEQNSIIVSSKVGF